MGKLHTNLLPWGVGAFCALIGSLMLVAPHQFASPAYAMLYDTLPLWGGMLLLVGAALLAVAVVDHSGAGLWISHGAAGLALLLLSWGFVRVGGWTGVVVYGVAGVGTMIAPLLRQQAPALREQAPRDWLALLLGSSAALNGAIMLLAPAQFHGVFYDNIRSILHWYGLSFLLGGLLVAGTQLWARTPPALRWGAQLLCALALWAWMPANSLPQRLWTGIAYYGGSGLYLVLLPVWQGLLRRYDPSALQVRLGLLLSLTAALPLIIALGLVTRQSEQRAVEQGLELQQTLAMQLARQVHSYLKLHQAAVESFALQPDLVGLPPNEQRDRLRALNALYRDFVAVTLLGGDGTVLARSDEQPTSAPISLGVFEQVQSTGGTAIARDANQALGRPLVVFGVPLWAADGQFGGALVAELDGGRMAETLAAVDRLRGTAVYVVDEQGQVVATAGAQPAATATNVTAAAPVTTLRAQGAPGHQLHTTSAGTQLAGYAPVGTIGWGVVVEQPLAIALAPVHAGRELAFVLLLTIVALVLFLGTLLSRRLTRSLKLLTRAADQFAHGADAPLPNSSIGEVRQLSTTFDLMRTRLRDRTTERDQLLEAERQARAQAEGAVQTRDVFFSIAAHELKTPLTSLLGNAQLLQRRWTRDGADERDLRAVGVIVQQARRLNQLLAMLLDLSRIQTGQLGIEPAWFDFAALVERVVEDMQLMAPGHQLEYQGPRSLQTVWGDALRLEQVVQNLVQNAIKYSPNGGPVCVRLSTHDDAAVLSVTDYGIGIPPDALPHIFTRFYRAPNADQQALSGFGIGLYVVKDIMLQHGGTIEVESSPGDGTTFTARLPLTPRNQHADLSLANAR